MHGSTGMQSTRSNLPERPIRVCPELLANHYVLIDYASRHGIAMLQVSGYSEDEEEHLLFRTPENKYDNQLSCFTFGILGC